MGGASTIPASSPPRRRVALRAACILLAAGSFVACGGDAYADIFCVGNGARSALVLGHVERVAGREAAMEARRSLAPSRASCTTCHLAPGPESLLVPNLPPLWPFNAYGQALTILRPGLIAANGGFDSRAVDEFARVDRLPVDPRDPAVPTFGDRIRRGLPPQPGPLSLPFLRSMSAGAAQALVDRDAGVCLAGLTDATAEVQETLAAGRCRLDLPALRRLESAALSRKLAASPVVYLGGLEDVPVEVVETLLVPVAGRRGIVLRLEALGPDATAALVKAEPNVLGQPIFIGRDLSADRLRALAGLPPGVGAPGLRLPKTCFPEITELSAELAAVAAECDVSFPNLRRLDSAALAAAVAKRDDGWRTLQSVRSMTPEAARQVSSLKPIEGLRLSSLRRLPADVATSLLQTTRPFLDVGSLEEISTEALQVVLDRIRNDSSASLVLGVRRLPAGPFAPSAEARARTKRFDLTLPGLETLSADDARNLVAFMRPVSDILSVKVSSLSPEAVNVVADWGGSFQLTGLETLPPDVAQALARLPARRGYAGSISLDDVKTLEPASLAALTQAKRPISCGGLTEITPELAAMLVKCPTLSLRFPLVKSITPEALAVLVTGTGQGLGLPGLTTVEPEVAALLAACPTWDPRLPAVKTLMPEAATALVSFVSRAGDLQLPGLTALEPGVAAALAKCERVVAAFPDVTTLEPAAAAALAACRRPVSLTGLKELTPELATALVACPTWTGALPGITGFDAPDSVAVATTLARRQGTLALPALRRISPKTLTALLGNPDVKIPTIETLTLIAEPDGSPTEDVVIPEEFQRRQQPR